MKYYLLLWIGFLIFTTTASCRNANFTMINYKKAVRSGLEQIPTARQIEEILGQPDHFISNSGNRLAGNDWNTEVFFEGRYILTMQVPVKMGHDFDRVLAVVGEPQFFLKEVESVDMEDRSIHATFRSENEWPYPFSKQEWTKVYESGGDFSAIGINLHKGDPVDGFEDYVAAIRKDRVKLED